MVHRVVLLCSHLRALDALAIANGDWYPFQFLPRAWLEHHLLASLWFLQQEPPVPNLLMGLVVRWCAWPVGVARVLVALYASLSILAAMLLLRILYALYPRRPWVATAVAIAFLLRSDSVAMETYSLGQTFYEGITAVLVTALIYALLGLAATGRARWTAGAGLAVATLALSRSTWSLFALPALWLVLLAAPRPRWRHAAWFLVPVLLLHGGWSLKNRMAYGRWAVATSTWGGAHALLALTRTGRGQDFGRFIVTSNAARPRQPGWFVTLFARGPTTPALQLLPLVGQMAAPAEIHVRDAAIEASLGGDPAPWNRIAGQVLFTELQDSFVRYVLDAPGEIFRQIADGYEVFWRPIRYYPATFFSLFRVHPVVRSGFDLRRVAVLALRGDLVETPYVTAGHWPDARLAQTSLGTLRWLDWPIHVASLAAVHLALPLLAVVALVGRLRRRRFLLPDGVQAVVLISCSTAYGYLAVLSSMVEYGENMRYRFSIEPVIWLITILTLTGLLRLARTGAARRRNAGDVRPVAG